MKISFYTLGCKVNQYESDSLAGQLEQLGFEVSSKLEFADVCIINSCAVTNEAEKKSRQSIAKVLKINPNAKVFVIGCAAQKNPKQFSENNNVCYVGGTANKQNLARIIYSKVYDFENKEHLFELPVQYETMGFSKVFDIRSFVKIQDGCNKFCTYCIIPYLRGRSRSRDFEDINNEVKNLIGKVGEIVLTGIDISVYKDEKYNLDLSQLVEKLSYFPGRIRLGSIEIGTMTEEFLIRLKNVKNFCPHFHLSLQSGSNNVLKKMNRHYTKEEFFEVVKLIRKHFDNPAITTDLIVGFPTETDQDFEETVEFLKQVGFSDVHVFPYSKREGTVASRWGVIDGNIVKQRIKEINQVCQKMKEDYIISNFNKPLTLLIEEFDGENYIGYTQNYIKCKLKGNYQIGQFVDGTLDNLTCDFIPLNWGSNENFGNWSGLCNCWLWNYRQRKWQSFNCRLWRNYNR